MSSHGDPSAPLLEARALTRHFKVGGAIARQALHAVDDVTFTIGRGEIVALVGESGSGKSTVARLLARVYAPTSGEIIYQGRPLRSMRSRRELLRYRSDVPMVFQDPFSSLNPVYRVSHGILRGLRLHRPELSGQQRWAEAVRVVEAVGLPLFVLFFNVSVSRVLLPLVGVIALATLGFVAVGTLFSALVIRTRFAELLLLVILLPFLLPPLIGAVQVTARLLAGRPLSESVGYLKLLAAYDIVFVSLASFLFRFTVDE